MGFMDQLVQAAPAAVALLTGGGGGGRSSGGGGGGSMSSSNSVTYAPTTNTYSGLDPGALRGIFGAGEISLGSRGSWWQKNATAIVLVGMSIIGLVLLLVFWPFSGPRSVKATAKSGSSSRASSRSRSKSKGRLKKGSPEAKAWAKKMQAAKRRKNR
jgi:hypothetical protein